MSIEKPEVVRSGGRSAAHTAKSYPGKPSPVRSSPNTSQMTASSNAATRSQATATTLRSIPEFWQETNEH